MIINLNQYRKKRRRTEAETQAKENRVRFGRSKEERIAELRERERAKKEIENKPSILPNIGAQTLRCEKS